MHDLWLRLTGPQSSPDRVAVIDDDGEHTLGELIARAHELADLISPDHLPVTVLVQADSSWRTVVATLAVGRLGGTLALLSNHATDSDYEVAREDVLMDVVVASPEVLNAWACVAPGAAALEGWHAVPLRADAVPGHPARWAGGCLIGMTSGSTGRAKAVVQAESALQYAADCTIEANALSPGDVVAGFVPLSSAAAFCFGLYLPLWLGSAAVFHSKWQPESILDRINETRAAWTMCVPTMLFQLASANAGRQTSLRSVTVGGGPMLPDALEQAEQSLGLVAMRVFGMSEALGHTTPALDEDPRRRLETDGRPFPGTELRAAGEDGTVLAADRVGSAQVKGPSVFLGYARNGAVAPPDLTHDGFFATGDLIRVNADGTINVAGREKDVIIRGGRNIDIVEVEHAIAHHPDVDEVCVVPVPDALFGERVAALVVTRTGAPQLAELLAFLEGAGFAKSKWPEYVFEVAELPQTLVGKLSRPEAKRLAAQLHGTEEPLEG